MADGEMTIKLDAEAARRMRAAAQAAGAEPDAYARDLINRALEAEDPDYWAGAREAAAEYDRTGEWISADEAFDRLEAMIVERQAAKR